ncbi:MAG: C_GCAxxG_C_C family protein [Eggerthellaceae bacterium]|nr:C_GCAxxG_C_C family protein [Eggerthellaceae bacterium]
MTEDAPAANARGPLDPDALASRTLALHEQRHNCAQSVACAFAPLTPFDEGALFALMEGFGSGMGAGCETCGAVSAGVAVIGALASDGRDLRTTKERTYVIADEFVEAFRTAHGTTGCDALRERSDVPKPHRCDAYLTDAARLLADVLERHDLVS